MLQTVVASDWSLWNTSVLSAIIITEPNVSSLSLEWARLFIAMKKSGGVLSFSHWPGDGAHICVSINILSSASWWHHLWCDFSFHPMRPNLTWFFLFASSCCDLTEVFPRQLVMIWLKGPEMESHFL